MKLLNLYAVVGIGVVAAVAACSSSSPGTSSGNKGDGGTSSGGSSSSGGTGSSGSGSGGDSGLPLPTITITSPTSGQTGVQITKATSTTGVTGTSGITAGDDIVTLALNLTNFTLMAPGACGGESANCGHLHVFVDYDVADGGTPCGETGAAYNAQVWVNPAFADLTTCANSDTINGPHTVRIELHQDDHAPINDPTTGDVIEATVSFTATGG